MPRVDDDRGASAERPRLPPVDLGRARVAPEDITPEVLAGFLTDGDEPVVRWALTAALRGRDRAAVYDELVRRAMELIGERWASGRWTVSEEHLATVTLLRTLAAVEPRDEIRLRAAPLAVLAGVAGEQHALGLTLLAHLLEEAGWSVANLGPNVPPDDLVRYVAKSEARLVGLTAAHPERLEALRSAIAALRALPVTPVVMVGGLVTRKIETGSLRVDWAGTSLTEAARFAREALAEETARTT